MKLSQLSQNITAAAVISFGIIVLGLCIKSAVDNFTNKDRNVVVKGLSEKEVDADKVTWPIVSKEVGDNLPELYQKIADKHKKIRTFLAANGIKSDEISENAPVVVDLNAERYMDNNRGYRYNITSTLTVTSRNVKAVRDLISRQGELLKEGIAIVEGDYDTRVQYEYVSFNEMKPKMMEEAISNAETTAQQFAKNSNSRLGKIVSATQGQFSIENRDNNTPYIKKVRVVTTVTYALKD